MLPSCDLVCAVCVEDYEVSRAAQRDMYAALKERRHALEEALRKKTELLKALCLKESVSTTTISPLSPLSISSLYSSHREL